MNDWQPSSEDWFWLRFWQSVLIAFVLFVWGFLAFNAVQMRTMVISGYCERNTGSGWIKCELLKDVTYK